VIVHYWLLSFALLLLWFPRQWLRFGGKVSAGNRGRGAPRSTRDVSLNMREEFTKPRNWIDAVRVITGCVALSFAFEKAPSASRDVATQIFTYECTVLVIAVLIQTLRFSGRKFTMVPPVFFILGLSFILIGWKAAVFACVMIWILNAVLPSAALFLFLFALLQLGFGRLLPGAPLREVLLAASLAMLPVVFSLMLKRRLGRVNKASRSPA
jgi:hypothetical protein